MIKVHQIFKELSLFIKDFSDITSFPDKSSDSFHRMRLKLGGQLDYKVVLCIVSRGYSIPVFKSLLLKIVKI